MSTIALNVLSVGFAGANRFLMSRYVDAPTELSRIARCFAAPSTSLAVNYCSKHSMYESQSSWADWNSPIVP